MRITFWDYMTTRAVDGSRKTSTAHHDRIPLHHYISGIEYIPQGLFGAFQEVVEYEVYGQEY